MALQQIVPNVDTGQTAAAKIYANDLENQATGVTNAGKIADIQAQLGSTPVTDIIGVTTLDPTTASSTINRTRVDNLYPLIGTGAGDPILKSLEVMGAVAGTIKIKVVQKTGTVGVYTVSHNFDATLVVGDNIFNEALFGVNRVVPRGSYIGFFHNTGAVVVVNGLADSSYTRNTGDYDGTGAALTTGTAVLQFKVTIQTVQSIIPTLQTDVAALKANGAQYPAKMFEWQLAGNGTGKGAFYVYSLLSGNKYARHKVGREIDTADNKYQDYYRYLGCDVVTISTAKVITPLGIVLLTSQEGEFVLRRSDSLDFLGGYHGNEKTTNMAIYVDGVAIDMTVAIPITVCRRVEYIEKSNMYRPYSAAGIFISHDLQLTHTKLTSFREARAGYTTRNYTTAAIDVPLVEYYSGIVCAGRNVVRYAHTDKDFIDRDLDVTGNDALLGGAGFREYATYNATVGAALHITSKVTSTVGGLQDAIQVLNIRDNSLPAQYKKYYRGIPANFTMLTGQTFASEMELNLY